jgi:CheY-like chemotaxis protein/two-component sensor histidine kinase
VAHDFNNLLAAIIGSLDLARKRMARGEDISGFIANAIQAAQRGATLTQRMLAFARKQELTFETVDLAAAVREMAELLGRTIGPQVSIHTRFPLVLPPVRTDRTQLELAILNLAVNARDAMPEGGRIVISAEHCSPPPGNPADTKFVCLSVEDEGEGMDAATLSRATEPFFTTKGVGKGTGLGLPMVHGLAEQCGGQFELRSAVGEGTTAVLWLPVADEETKETVAEDPASLPAPSVARRILAVDDDALILLNTVMMLEDQGHTVFHATSGQSALEILEGEDIDLLLTDYAMPRMTGRELTAQALARWPTLKVVIVSGYADLPAGEQLGAPRLGKPFSETELAAVIDRVCGSQH